MYENELKLMGQMKCKKSLNDDNIVLVVHDQVQCGNSKLFQFRYPSKPPKMKNKKVKTIVN